jgi:hypothetical protein
MQNHSFKPDFKYETKKQLPSLSRRFPLTGTPWQEVIMITAFFVFNHYIFIIFCHSSGGFYLPKVGVFLPFLCIICYGLAEG